MLWNKYEVRDFSKEPLLESLKEKESHFSFITILIIMTFTQLGKDMPTNEAWTDMFAGLIPIPDGWWCSSLKKTEEEESKSQSNEVNQTFKCVMLFQLFVAVVYMIVLGRFQENQFQAVNWITLLFMIPCLLFLVLYERRRKGKFIDTFTRDGKSMEYFFKTRLGLHSPR